MDDIVKAAMKKWPAVPACYGWLALDARGDWYLRDDATQAAGAFPQVKGSRLTHRGLCEFIARNYQPDETGAWYFQNGPQKVFVQLEAAPYVLAVQRDGRAYEVHTHTGLRAGAVRESWVDEAGRLFLGCTHAVGLVRSADMDAAADAIEAGLWQPEPIDFGELPRRWGYRLDPQP